MLTSNPKELVNLPVSRIQSWVAQGRLSAAHPITPLELYQSRCVRPLRDGIKLLASSHSHDRSLDAQPPLATPLHIVVSRASSAAIAAVERAGGTVTTRYYTAWALRQITLGRIHPVLSLRSREVVEGRVEPPGCGPATGMILRAAVARAQGSLEAGTAVTRSNVEASDGGSEEAPQEEGSRGVATSAPLPPHVPRIRRQFRYRLPDPTRRTDIEYYRDPAHRGYLAYTVQADESPSLFFRPPREEDAKKRATDARARASKAKENRIF